MIARVIQKLTFGVVVPKRWYDTAYNASRAHRRQRDAWKDIAGDNATKIEGLWHRLQEMQKQRDYARKDCQRLAEKLDRIQNLLDFGVCDDSGPCQKCNENHEDSCRP